MENEGAKKRVILDVDVGTDDYLALLIFLHAEQLQQVRIDAIICSTGNTTCENVCKNVARLLEIVKRTDIPVYKGASQQLIPPQHEIEHFHGIDGFGDLIHENEPDLSIIRNIPGAIAMRDIIINNPNEISLICIAPLTNAALAIKLYGDFVQNLKDIWIMGGNYTAVGNATAAAEYNFYIDPEAAYIVLDSITQPIYIVTWETCLNTNISFDWRYNKFGNTSNPAILLLNRAEKKIYGDCPDPWLPCDAFLAAVYLHPKLIIKQSLHHATVELRGSETRGQIVLDHLKRRKPNVTIIESINIELYKDLLMEVSTF